MTGLESSSHVSVHRGRRTWFLALGALLLVLGAAGLTAASLLELTSVLVFGPLLLASSLMQFLTAVFAERGKEKLLHLTAAGLEAVLGFLFMANPLHSVVGLIGLVAAFLVIGGLVRLARSLVARSRGRGWTAVAGIVAVLLGVSLWVEGPVAKLWLVGLCIAGDLICHGIGWSALALAERKPLRAPAT
jgi:uncharacterized membrane protein HdeD (DUF308 family)